MLAPVWYTILVFYLENMSYTCARTTFTQIFQSFIEDCKSNDSGSQNPNFTHLNDMLVKRQHINESVYKMAL